ncbi:uncharacterized protein LOC120192098 [Hibiscus syriacus]|uniref:uncharacterized protein LOC120192098 n=1 Tax=Hibiscus syriacus TaxID=106335 RepID=UPI001921265F|nr:uncharacterized protein LOC120192098 [Hibiscus syriacus]
MWLNLRLQRSRMQEIHQLLLGPPYFHPAQRQRQEFKERNDGTKDSQPASPIIASFCKAVFKAKLHEGILDGQNLEVSFDNFPYYLSENTKNVLIEASFIHLKHKKHAKYTSELTSVNPRILLSGPAGSEIYQEMLTKALANYFGAKLLIFSSHAFSGDLSAEETQLLKDGINAEKSCIYTKQSPGPTDLAEGLPTVEAVTSSPVAAPACVLESQPMTEAITMPSSSRTSKNQMFNIGIYSF